MFIAVLVFPRPGQAASAREAVRQGNRLYEQGKFADSLKMYEEALDKAPESDIVNFNAGTALYKQQQYDEAIDHFQKTILSDDASLRERAYYNLGNSFYKSGIEKEKTDIHAAITALRESLRHLAGALALDKKDKDAQYNYDFVNKELERLREEQQQQSQQNQDGQKDQEQQQEQQKGSSPSESSEAQEQKQENKEQSPAESSSTDEPREQASLGEKSQEERQGSATSGSTASGQELILRRRPSPALQGGDQGAAQYNNPEQAPGFSPGSVEGLTKSEAERLLQNYQQTEEPQGLLHVFEEKHETGAVIKDW